jgi:hypothetical protein
MNLTLPFTLSKSLIDAYTLYCKKHSSNTPFSRAIISDIHKHLSDFENKTLYVSSFDEYLRLISFVYSKNKNQILIGFNDNELDVFYSIINNHNTERSKVYSLFLSSFLFTSGKFPIPVKDFFSYFISNKQDYSYQLFITKDIYKLYSDMRKNNNLPITALLRAAHFYYQNIAPDKFHITESPEVTVTNASTGWKKFYIRGSLSFKNYLFGLKQSTGKTINCIANNVTYQFLSAIKENVYEK